MGVTKSLTGLSDFPFQAEIASRRGGSWTGARRGPRTLSRQHQEGGEASCVALVPLGEMFVVGCSRPPQTLSPRKPGSTRKALVTQGFLASCAPGWEPVTRDVTSDGLSWMTQSSP